MTTLPNMGIDLPTPGGDSGTWDDKINAGFGLVDAHNHSAGKGLAVPTAGLNINADLPFGGFGATALGRVAFNAVAALTTGSKTIFVSAVDNELYWRNQAGVNVKLTSGTSINTTLVGGILGDYSTVGAEVAYVDADKTYTFKDQTAPKKWARLASGPVRIYEYNTNETVYVEHAIAAALAVSYTVTWPAAPPAVKALVQVTPAGLLSYDNTGVDAIVMAANKDITMSGTGRVIHGDRTKSGALTFDPGAIVTVAGAPANNSSWNGGTFTAFSQMDMGVSGDAFLRIPVEFLSNERLKSITMHYVDNSNANTTMSVFFGQSATGALLLAASTGGGSASIITNQTCTITAPATPTRGLWVRLSTAAASAGPKPHAWTLIYDAV